MYLAKIDYLKKWRIAERKGETAYFCEKDARKGKITLKYSKEKISYYLFNGKILD